MAGPGGGLRSAKPPPRLWAVSCPLEAPPLLPSRARRATPGDETTFPGMLRGRANEDPEVGRARAKGTREVAGGDGGWVCR